MRNNPRNPFNMTSEDIRNERKELADFLYRGWTGTSDDERAADLCRYLDLGLELERREKAELRSHRRIVMEVQQS